MLQLLGNQPDSWTATLDAQFQPETVVQHGNAPKLEKVDSGFTKGLDPQVGDVLWEL